MQPSGNQTTGPNAPILLIEAIEQQVAGAIARVRRHAAFTHNMIMRCEGPALHGPGTVSGSKSRCPTGQAVWPGLVRGL